MVLESILSLWKSTEKTDFEWHYDEEPHASRRKEILKKYPQIKKLFGPCPRTKWIVLGVVTLQVFAAWAIKDSAWWIVLLSAYLFGGCANQAMALALHELSHNLAFRKPLYNQMLAMFANLPMAIPAAVTFKRYHLEHHRYQGEAAIDTDLPMDWEGKFFNNTPMKMLWCFLQPAFYALRPTFSVPKAPTQREIINYAVCLGFDYLIYHFWGGKALTYLFAGTLLGMGIHPVAGHFIAEHYVFVPGIETYSYYGPLNAITWNVGYHNEHHDFPYIPGSRLHLVRKIAPEYYDEIPQHMSWFKVIFDYIFDPKQGPYARVKRTTMSGEQVAQIFKREAIHAAGM